jgi:hypothetical protein
MLARETEPPSMLARDLDPTELTLSRVLGNAPGMEPSLSQVLAR